MPAQDQNQDQKNTDAPCSFWRSRYALGFLLIGAVAAYFLLTEHLAHVAGALPYLLLLACPLMHVFMHHGHGKHRHHQAQKDGQDAQKTGKPS
jgi:hypothetical protein